MIVIGNPLAAASDAGPRAAGLPVAIARAATEAGARVEILGRVGEDAAGDAILLELAGTGIGHAAVLRDAGHATGRAAADADEAVSPSDEPPANVPGGRSGVASPRLDAADVELGLRYLPDYRVIVVAEPLDEAGLAAAISAARWASAAIVVVVPAGSAPPETLDADATVLEAPPNDAETAFAALVGRYAAELDRGTPPADAFAFASAAVGSEAKPG